MTCIHFKLSYNGKTYRFAPPAQGNDQLLEAVKDQVASLVKEEAYTLCWNDGASSMLLDSHYDFFNMLKHAEELGKSSTKPPCIYLTVAAADAVTERQAPAPFEVAAVVIVPSAEPAVDTPTVADASESPAEEPFNGNVSKVHSLLDVADEKHRTVMDELRTFAEELKTDKRLTVHSFSIRPTRHALYGGDVELDFHFKSRVDYSLWKTCIEATLSKLDISESALRGNFMPIYPGIENESWMMHVELETKDVKNVLDLLKPLAGRTDFNIVTVDEKKPKHLRLVREFLEGAFVKLVNFQSMCGIGLEKPKKTKPTDFSTALDLLQLLQPTKLRYFRNNVTQETLNFLEDAANLVDHIVIVSIGYDMKKEKPLPLSLAQNILSKKCNYLNIADTTTKITLAEAEELVKYFEEKEMKVSLAIPTKEKMMDIKVGSYRVKFANLTKWSRGCSQLLVEHDDIERKMEEIEHEDNEF